MKTITILYDTKSGHTHRMAEAILEGIDLVEGVRGVLKTVDEVHPDDLVQSEGLILGSPTHCGLVSWKIKKFFDEHTGAAWGKVEGHIATAFTTAGGLGGGSELALLSMHNLLMNYGYLVFGLPAYTAPGVTAHYGAVSIGYPDDHALKSCRMLGEKAAALVSAMGHSHPSKEA